MERAYRDVTVTELRQMVDARIKHPANDPVEVRATDREFNPKDWACGFRIGLIVGAFAASLFLAGAVQIFEALR